MDEQKSWDAFSQAVGDAAAQAWQMPRERVAEVDECEPGEVLRYELVRLYQALNLAKSLLSDIMTEHSIYPSLGNFAFIEEVLAEVEALGRERGISLDPPE